MKSDRRRSPETKTVEPELAAKALAKAVCEGDIVNFRLVFSPFSPARRSSTERFEAEKYSYLLPDDDLEGSMVFKEALQLVQKTETWEHIQKELEEKRPAQMPSELLMVLGDHAVRAGKYTSAAQAYELLRIRPRIQEEYLRQADAALDEGNIRKAVRGYRIATGLAYNYAAFPEPLPNVPDYQTRALMLHGQYPERPEDCVALQEPQSFLSTALSYLLLDAEAAARLGARSVETRVMFLKELVAQIDVDWNEFTERFHDTLQLAKEFGKRLEQHTQGRWLTPRSLAEEIDQAFGEDPHKITAHLLGREIEGGEWWQYLKELAYKHPAGVLFISRQSVGEREILVPRYRADSPVPAALGLLTKSG
ncbi:MAG: hypothetical protein HY706_11160 [Candidatus Hydrogenedentes bacterium]|nr:hypothetical protein [Candidatus Hydrogenedentota bacterium]